ncbi:MAG: O-antigen ligase family protein [Clostridiales bacterium]|nr:O-antigen ligase family protein [Clostridiales bacterium]
MQKLSKLLLNNFYFCLFYIIYSTLSVTIVNSLPHFNLLYKLILLWGGFISISNIIRIIKRKPNKIEISIFLLLGVTLILNIFFYFSINNIKFWFVNLITLLSIFFIDDYKKYDNLTNELKILSNTYILISGILSVISIILHYTNKNFLVNEFSFGNTNGLFINENSLGISAAIGFFICIYLIYINKNSKARPIYCTLAFIELIAIYSSTSRSALLVFIAVIIVFLLYSIKNIILRIFILVSPLILTLSSIFIESDFLINFTTSRNELWISAAEVIKNHLFIGTGNSKLVEMVHSVRPDAYLPGLETGGLHNIYMQILTTNGLITLVLFLLVVGFSIFYILNNKQNSGIDVKILLMLLVGILLTNLFESNLFYSNSFISVLFWTYLGYATSIKREMLK